MMAIEGRSPAPRHHARVPVVVAYRHIGPVAPERHRRLDLFERRFAVRRRFERGWLTEGAAVAEADCSCALDLLATTGPLGASGREWSGDGRFEVRLRLGVCVSEAFTG